MRIYKSNKKVSQCGVGYLNYELGAAIELEVENRKITEKLRGEAFNPWLKWGLISSGIVVSLLLAFNLFNPTVKNQPQAISVEKNDVK
ncbi:MAG: hypothetical protein WBA13_01230 [Microcoleaceae cyanobacterium]